MEFNYFHAIISCCSNLPAVSHQPHSILRILNYLLSLPFPPFPSFYLAYIIFAHKTKFPPFFKRRKQNNIQNSFTANYEHLFLLIKKNYYLFLKWNVFSGSQSSHTFEKKNAKKTNGKNHRDKYNQYKKRF